MNSLRPEDIAKVKGNPLLANVSGGKDSTAMALALLDAGLQPTFVFADTGWENDRTYEYIWKVLEPKLGKIHKVSREKGGMEELVRSKQMFPSQVIRFCTEDLKVLPLADFGRAYGPEAITAVGIRAQESEKRSKLQVWDFGTVEFPLYKGGPVVQNIWRPILHWSLQDVLDIHAKHGVPMNPLYDLGFSRVGCWPCIYARKDEIRKMSTDTARVDKIETLERELSEKAGDARRFFQSKRRDKAPQTIREVVDWSKIDRRGTYIEDVPDRDGCMRWGLCDGIVQQPEEESTPEIFERLRMKV